MLASKIPKFYPSKSSILSAIEHSYICSTLVGALPADLYILQMYYIYNTR